LPVTFVAYMASWLIIQAILRQTHAPLWLSLLAGVVPFSVFMFGLRADRRSPPAP